MIHELLLFRITTSSIPFVRIVSGATQFKWPQESVGFLYLTHNPTQLHANQENRWAVTAWRNQSLHVDLPTSILLWRLTRFSGYWRFKKNKTPSTGGWSHFVKPPTSQNFLQSEVSSITESEPQGAPTIQRLTISETVSGGRFKSATSSGWQGVGTQFWQSVLWQSSWWRFNKTYPVPRFTKNHVNWGTGYVL